MTVQVVRYAAHTAFLEPVTGQGYLVLPAGFLCPGGASVDIDGDVSMQALYRADHDAALWHLHGLGYQLSEPDGPGFYLRVGYTLEGRQIVGVHLRDMSAVTADLDDFAGADVALQAAAGLRVGF